MQIIYHEKSKQFHLFNNRISYVIGVLPNGELGQLYYGPKIKDIEELSFLGVNSVRPLACTPSDNEGFSLEFAQIEYPSFGTGDFRSPAYEIKQENGSRLVHAVYDRYEIIKGKRKLSGLPATYVNCDDEAVTLIVTLKDEVANFEIDLSYTIWRDYPVVCRNAKFRSLSKEKLVITKALSMCLDLPDKGYQWIQFQGAWARERYPMVRDIVEGVTSIESMRGHSSAMFNPFVIVKRPNTDEFQGEAIGLSFVYSGNFVAHAEVENFGKTRLMMGINPRWFEWPLECGEEFQTPEVVMTYTKDGLNDLSHSIHDLFSNNLIRSPYKNKVRPILLNNWEATGPDFNEESILKIAKKGKEAGIELFVLDDGWFGARNNDIAGLGDWFENREKLPNGMAGLSKKVNELGLKMGFWIEPEMVNADSDLYRAHPDWVLAIPDRDRSLGRHQMVLDYSKPEVVDYIYAAISKVMAESDIEYIKWDMNRSITECFSLGKDSEVQGTIYHKYIMGVYSLYERLIEQFPHILFESCASGGARFDAGMLYYAPQAWCSDDTDAVERIKIQYGTTYGYPVASMGSHVSEVPNQQTGRMVSIDTRGNVAYFGTFGYELDLNELDDAEFEKVKAQVEFMKTHRSTIQLGDFYRISSPFENNTVAWMSVSKDKKEAIVGIFEIMKLVNEGFERVKLVGLDPDVMYQVSGVGAFYGDYLMNIGLEVQNPNANWFEQKGDFRSTVVVLTTDVN